MGNRSSRMSASSLLLAWLALLAFICTSLADADVVAGTTSKCLDTCRTAGDGICQDEVMGWVRLGRAWRRSGAWCEFGTDCTDCGPQDLPLLLVDPRPPHDDPAAPDGPGTMLVPAVRYTISFLVSFDWRRWSVVRAGLQSYLQCFEPDCTVELRYHNNTTLRYTDTIQGGVIVEAVVTDTAINGSSTATVEQAVALCQKNKGTGLFKALAAIVEGSVTASAPRMVMVRTLSYAFLRMKMRRKMRLWAYFGLGPKQFLASGIPQVQNGIPQVQNSWADGPSRQKLPKYGPAIF